MVWDAYRTATNSLKKVYELNGFSKEFLHP